MGMSENVNLLATRVATEIKSVRGALATRVTLDTAQRIIGVKEFDLGSLLLRNSDGSVKVAPYSSLNPPPASSGPYTSLFTAADQAISTAVAATNTDVTTLSFAMAANTTYEIEGAIYWTVAATTTGFRWGLAGPIGTTSVSAEYATAATTEGIFVQQNNNIAIAPTMTVTTASAFAAPFPNMLTYRGMVTCGAVAGALRIQMASELASTALTVKRGSSLSYRAV